MVSIPRVTVLAALTATFTLTATTTPSGRAPSTIVAAAVSSGPVTVTSGEYAGQKMTVWLQGEYSGYGNSTLITGNATITIGKEVFAADLSLDPAWQSLCCGSGDVFPPGDPAMTQFWMWGQVRHTTAAVPHNHLFGGGVVDPGLLIIDILDQTNTTAAPPIIPHDPGIGRMEAIPTQVTYGETSETDLLMACADTSKAGAMRKVGGPAECSTKEVFMMWNQVGPKGDAGPRGGVGPQGIQGAQGIQGPPGPGFTAAPPCVDLVNRYVNCGNGTVTDTATGLIWLRQWDCFGPLDWASAHLVARGLREGQCGLTDGSQPGDWRLPTLAEWRATIDRAQQICTGFLLADDSGTRCIDASNAVSSFPAPFRGVDSFWASDSSDVAPSLAALISLISGLDFWYYKDDLVHEWRMWPVRKYRP